MKFKTFRNIVVALIVVGCLGTCMGVRSCSRTHEAAEQKQRDAADAQWRAELSRKADEENARRAQLAAANATRAAASASDDARRGENPGAFFGAAPGLRPVDTDLLGLLQRPVVEKIKDGTHGKPWKINLYSDDKTRWNRAKVDLDRDEKADESWTIKADGAIERSVSSRDDERYDRTYRLDVTAGWLDLSAAPAAPPTPPSASLPSLAHSGASPAAGARAVDADMLALVKLPVQEKIKDATKGKAYKINLYSDDGQRFNRAKVDLDRDDKWDESWTFKADGSTERQVAPADDEKYTEVWVLERGGWKKK